MNWWSFGGRGSWYLDDAVLAALDGLTETLGALRLQTLVEDLLKRVDSIIHLLGRERERERERETHTHTHRERERNGWTEIQRERYIAEERARDTDRAR